MKKVILAAALLFSFAACSSGDGVMTRKGDTYVVNTTEIGKVIEGYKGPTPLLVYIQNETILKVEALENTETPGYFQSVKEELLSAWDGMPVSEVIEAQVDAVSGATWSSQAVVANVHEAVRYYLLNR